MTTTTENIRTWATTKAGNASADAAITSADTQAPDTLDDNIRSIMAAARRESDDRGGAIVAGGTSTALTVTTASGIASGHIANGLTLKVRTASSATGAATIAVDGLTAVDIKNNAGTAIASGDWASGAILILVYSSTATAFLCANILSSSSLNISGLTEDTAPAHATDFLATYDTSASGNKKVLPRNLFPAKQASFYAHRNGVNQAVATSAATGVTFGTELFDVGAAFGTSTWTPPAGTARVTAHVTFSGVGNDQSILLMIYQDGVEVARSSGWVIDSSSEMSLEVTSTFQTSGTNAYVVVVQSSDSSYNVLGAFGRSYFCGEMI